MVEVYLTLPGNGQPQQQTFNANDKVLEIARRIASIFNKAEVDGIISSDNKRLNLNHTVYEAEIMEYEVLTGIIVTDRGGK